MGQNHCADELLKTICTYYSGGKRPHSGQGSLRPRVWSPEGLGYFSRRLVLQADQPEYPPPHKLEKMSETMVTATTPDTKTPSSRFEGGWQEPFDTQPLPPVDTGKHAYRFLGAAFIIEGLVWVRPSLPMPWKEAEIGITARDFREAMVSYSSIIFADHWEPLRAHRH